MKKITFTTALLASACAFGGFEGHVSADGYVPGLQQGIFRNGGLANVNFSATCAEADRFSHTLGTILADANQSRKCQVRNELTGAIEKWEVGSAVIYEGEMYFEGGREYNFFGAVDNFFACQLDGGYLFSQGGRTLGAEGVSVFSKTFKASGWHSIRVWIADYGWDRGANVGLIGFQGMGIGWNTNGCKVVNATTQTRWNRFLDDGSGRLLRSKVLPQKSVLQGKCGPIGTKDGEVRVFGAQDGLPVEIEMVWVPGRGEIDGFWLSKDLITQRQWKNVIRDNSIEEDEQNEHAQALPLRMQGEYVLDFILGLNARCTVAGRFARISDAQWQLAAKYCTVGLPLESTSFRIAFRPTDRRNSEHEAQKLVKRGSDIAFEAMLAKGEAKRYSLADGLDLDVIKVEGCGDTFYLGRYEVTQEQYEKVMESNPSIYSGVDNLPVSSVNWTNAMVFCEKLNALVPVEGMAWTLPSSTQWAFAANGGLNKKGNSFFGGDNWREVGWWGANEYGSWWTHPVGLKKPNELGFHDLFGNVWEWCCDDDGRKDCKYRGGPGIGHNRGNIEYFICTDANRNNADFGFRVALVSKAQLANAELAEVKQNQSGGLRRTGLFGGGSLRARRLQRQQEEQAAAAKQQTELTAQEKAQREVEREEQRQQLLTIQEELRRVREAKAAAAGAKSVKDTAKNRTSTQSIIDGMLKVPEKDYWLSETELTQGQWVSVMGNNPSEHKGANLPVECVSRNDCDVFLEKLNQTKEVQGSRFVFSLPTEGEWLQATRVEGDILDRAWVQENSSNQTHAVATKAPNAFGFYDMQGNVWEWLANDQVSKGCRRGGAFSEGKGGCSVHRWIHTPRGRRYGCCGLRLAAHLRPTNNMGEPKEAKATDVQAKIDAAKAAVDNIKGAVTTWMLDNKKSTPPSTLSVLVKADGDKKSILDGGEESLVDPWGQSYMIQIRWNWFAIVSAGPDTKFHTADDIRTDNGGDK